MVGELEEIMEITELCEIAYKYGTDKCPQIKHGYTPVYYEMFKDIRNSVKKVFEMGIGYYKTMAEVAVIYDRGLKRFYQKGASLKMWRDFFPNARIYGADIAPETMFRSHRINTYVCDERKKEDLEALVKKTGSDIDIFIDDGSHKWQDQAFLAKTILPMLKKDIIYIIEDVGFPNHIIDELKDYECSVPRLPYTLYKVGKFKNKIPKDRLLIVQNK